MLIDRVAELTADLADRATIGQVIGIVMERYAITDDRASAFLVDDSRTTETRLQDVAAHVVETVNDSATSTVVATWFAKPSQHEHIGETYRQACSCREQQVRT